MLFKQPYKNINNKIKRHKTNKINQSISPIYKNYFNNISKNDNSININSFPLKDNNKSNNLALASNSFSKTTKNSPRNLKADLKKFQFNRMNNELNSSPKFDTNLNSPKNNFLKKVNFKAEKLNLNVKTLNMNLEIKKYNNCPNNQEINNNLSILNNNTFIEDENKRNELSKIKLNDLRNQLSEIITPNKKKIELRKLNSYKAKNNIIKNVTNFY